MKWTLRTYTTENLQSLANESSSIRDMMIKMGLKGGGSYGALKKLLNDRKIVIDHFTGKAWSKGLTKQNHPAIKLIAEKVRAQKTGRPGSHLSKETKAKLSKARTSYLESNPNHGLKWFSIVHDGTITKVQGTWEKQVANWLTEIHIPWERKTLDFHTHRKYTPDFYIPSLNIYIEVKGFWRDRDVHKMYLVLDDNNIDLRYVDKTNIKNLSLETLPKFIDKFKREDINFENFKNVWSNDGMADM